MGQGRGTKALVVVVALAFVAVAAVGCGGGGTSSSGGGTAKTPYKLGAVLSLTGTYSGLGMPEKNTLDMEVARINAAGGVNGHPIDVVIVDDATDPAKAVSATSKLIDQEKVIAVLGATGTGQTMAMRPAVDKAGIPQVSMAGGNVITAQLDKNVFATPWSNSIVVPFTLKYLQGQGVKKVALLTDTGGFGKDGHAVLLKDLPTFGMTAVADETFNPGDTDMSAQLTKIKAAGADVIVMWNAGKESAIVAKNREQLKIATPLVGSHGNARKEFVDSAGTAAEGFRFAAGKVLVPEAYGAGTDEFKLATDFIARYTKTYNAAPSTFAGHAYDALNLTVDAMKKLPEGFTSAQLRDQIEKTSGFVGIGGVFTFSATDHNGLTDKDLVMYEIKNGAFTVLK